MTEEPEMVEGDADDMAEALAEISSTLACQNNSEDILHAIDSLKRDSERWDWYVDAMINVDGAKRAALIAQPFPATTKEAWNAAIDAAMADTTSGQQG